jgi:SAM-dependent methyltransferase
VVATDIEARWLEELDEPNIEVCQANILTDPLGDNEFDLIHARLLLTHVEAPVAVENMVTALRPGGALFLAEPDFGTVGLVNRPVKELERFWEALGKAMIGPGGDPYVGRKLPELLKTASLIDIEVQGRIDLRWDDDVYLAVVKDVAPARVPLHHYLGLNSAAPGWLCAIGR